MATFRTAAPPKPLFSRPTEGRPCSQFYSRTISKKAGKSGISAVWRTIQNEDENWVIAICPLI
jgi:hypothetical protein